MAKKDREIWENKNKSQVWIMKENVRGDVESVPVRPGTRVELTVEDRQRNQEVSVDKSLDVFSNGMLSSVQLIDTAEDYEEVNSNPNSKSESEIRDLLELNANQLKKELAEIDSPLVIERLRDFVNSDDDKASNVTVAKVKAVNARYEELHPPVTGKVFDSYEEAIAKPQKISNY